MERLDQLIPLILEMGQYAVENQKEIAIDYKGDGSIITETDLTINKTLSNKIKELFPEAQVISEEEKETYSMDTQWTFVLDPIDGTDAYSQGLPSWCIAIGILDRDKEPVGAIINAPRFGVGTHDGLFIRQNPYQKASVNGKPMTNRLLTRELRSFATSSKILEYFPLPKQELTLRGFGSNILNMLAPVLFTNIQGSFTDPKCSVWDVGASHAILRSEGMNVIYYDGTPFKYDENLLLHRKSLGKALLAGTAEALVDLQKLFV